MPDQAHAQLISWLNDAYAMERALVEVLERHARDAQDDPEVHDRLIGHLDETHRHAETVRGCIEALGGKVESARAAIAAFFGAGEGMMNRAFDDTQVRNVIADYAAEHYEIAVYHALIKTAEFIGEHEIAERLRPVLHQETEMARFLERHLVPAVERQLAAAVG